MPIYEYVCSACQARFEKLVRRFGEEVSCPSCRSGAVDKQLSTFAVSVSSPTPAFAGCGAGACSPGEQGCGAGACGGGGCELAN
jgi:putative FmdB family regulatory protein